MPLSSINEFTSYIKYILKAIKQRIIKSISTMGTPAMNLTIKPTNKRITKTKNDVDISFISLFILKA